MGLLGAFLDDVWVISKVKNKKVGKNVVKFDLHLKVINKRFSAKLRDVEIIQVIPKWFVVTKKPKSVRISGEDVDHQLLVWKVGMLKPLGSKELVLSFKLNKEKGREESTHISNAFASYKKFMGKKWKSVWDRNAGGGVTVKV